MLPSIVKPLEIKPSFTRDGSIKRSFKETPPIIRIQNFSSGCMDNVRKNLLSQGISERASELIISSRREGTNTNYSSAWNKWSSWCSERQADPFCSDVNIILDYLASLFESGCEYSTMFS